MDLLKLALGLRTAELPDGSADQTDFESSILSATHMRSPEKRNAKKNGSAAFLNQIDIMAKPAELTGKNLCFFVVFFF